MNKKKGFTLIEVIVVSLITGIVGLGVISTIANSNSIMNRSYELAMVNGNLKMILDAIERDVKAGVVLTTTIDGSFGDNAGHELIITMPDLSTVKWTSEYSTQESGYTVTRYGQDGSKMLFRMFGSEGTSKNEYKYIYPRFKVNTDLSTGAVSIDKYHRVWAKLQVYVQNGSSYYSNWSSEKTMHCRLEHIGYGL